MIAKIIVASVIGLISFAGLVISAGDLAKLEVFAKGKDITNEKVFYGTMMALVSILLTITIVWFAYNL